MNVEPTGPKTTIYLCAMSNIAKYAEESRCTANNEMDEVARPMMPYFVAVPSPTGPIIRSLLC